jgi:ferric-dicitrate binding protein FerR (iron transport regulator)
MMTADNTMEEVRKHAAPAQKAAAQEPHGPEQRPADGIRLTEEQLRARRARSIAIALALGAFVAVIFAVTIVRLGSNVFTGPDYMRPVQTTK